MERSLVGWPIWQVLPDTIAPFKHFFWHPHDVSSDKIPWFLHSTKQETRANWEGTSSGAEGDMNREILDDVKAEGFIINQIMDHVTSGANITSTSFPKVRITYYGNHTVKAFHST